MVAMFDKRLAELKMTPADFLRKFILDWGENAIARNHMYKVLSGGSILGESDMFPKFVKSMKLNHKNALENLKLDKIEDKFGIKTLPEATEVVQDTARLMTQLSDSDQEEVLQIVKIKAKAKHN